jgi:hypothetical protein
VCCSRWLPLDEFVANPHAFLGRSSWCRECHREAPWDWRARNRERINAERREAYREAHPLPARGCAFCGRLFEGRPNALVCSSQCREERKAEQRRARRAAA